MPKTEKTLEKRRFTCSCGETIVYDNPNRGVVNIGDFQRVTGWHCIHNTYTYEGIYICPVCMGKARQHAEEIAELVGTPYVSVSSFVKVGQ